MILKDLAGAVNAVLPERLSEDVRRNVRAAVRSAFENMDLVSREELEVQRQVLLRTREKLEMLEKRVAELEGLLDKNAPEAGSGTP
jgi:BMFP domain-containing protein YqiC